MKEKIEECKKQFHKEKKGERKLFFTTFAIILGNPLSNAKIMTTIDSIGNFYKIQKRLNETLTTCTVNN